MAGNLSGGRRGQALVEFALVVPILLLMVVGVMEFGRAWMRSQVVTDAARQGARMASILNDTGVGQDSVRVVVRNALRAGSIDPATATITVDSGWQTGTNTPVSVTVAVPFDFGVFRPVMAFAQEDFEEDDIMLRSTSIMRNE